MKHSRLLGIVAGLASTGLVSACAPPSAGSTAASPSNAASTTNASPAQSSAAKSNATPAAPNANAKASPDANAASAATPATASTGAAATKASAAATPGAASGTISGQVTASPAKYGRHVVVWLDGGGLPTKPLRVEIDQKSMKFLPYMTAVPVGTRVVFRNSDPFPHNVFSPDAKKFNLGMMPANSARSHVFKQAGPHTLLCSIHPGMLAYVYVVPSKYYAVADSSGHYTIKNVANGTYKISAWAPKLATSTQSVTVSGGSVTVSLHLHRGG